jgi:hypothetical protein
MAESKLTYAELAAALGITAKDAERKAIRAHITTMLRQRRLRMSLVSARTRRRLIRASETTGES